MPARTQQVQQPLQYVSYNQNVLKTAAMEMAPYLLELETLVHAECQQLIYCGIRDFCGQGDN